MPFELVPFREEHVEAAAQLITASYRVYRSSQPALPDQWTSADERATAIRDDLTRGPGVVALENGRLVGFLGCCLQLPGPAPPLGRLRLNRAADFPETAHAAVLRDGHDVYREMYSRLSSRLVANGCFEHTVTVPAADKAAIDAWFSLGFGLQTIVGVRSIGPVAGAPAEVTVRRAALEDADAFCSLVMRLARFHATAPIFSPLSGDYRALRRAAEMVLTDDSAAVWLAIRGAAPLGLMSIQTAAEHISMDARTESGVHIAEAVTAASARFEGVGTAILAHAFRWAAEAGFERCTVGWESANLLSSRFWPSRGFEPLFYRLKRRIDPNIAWANAHLDDDLT